MTPSLRDSSPSVGWAPEPLQILAETAAAAWPLEGAGVLGGHRQNRHFEVLHAVQADNPAGPDRFEILPAAVATAEARFRQLGCQLLGFFHSHPHPPGRGHGLAQPSALDITGGWRDHLTVIVTTDGRCTEAPRTFLIDRAGTVAPCREIPCREIPCREIPCREESR